MNPLLSGVRILDLTRMLTGDYAAMLMGDLGAEVIKIETPGTGDPLRQMPPHFLEGESGANSTTDVFGEFNVLIKF